MASLIQHDQPVNLAQRQAQLKGHWQPESIMTIDGDHSFKIATISGSFIWHAHPNTDEVFYCISGGPLILDMATNPDTKHERDGFESVTVKMGEVFKVPRGYRHRPHVERETGILMVEKIGTVNTGDEENSEEGKGLTVEVQEDH